MSRRSLHSTASDSAGGSLIRVVEIPQQGYPPQSSFTPLETVWFDIRLKTLLYAQANAFPEEWSEPWTSGECGQKASFRVNWPGYQGCSRTMNIKDYRGNPRPITKLMLGRRIAAALAEIMENFGRIRSGMPEWRVGENGIRVEDVVLLGFHHVSKGSWQASLGLAQT